MVNPYAKYIPTCLDCEECENIWTAQGGMCTCRSLRDGIHDELGIDVSEVQFDPDQDASRCDSFDPTEEFLERIDGDESFEAPHDCVAGTDYPATL